jgi:hypothetical protein
VFGFFLGIIAGCQGAKRRNGNGQSQWGQNCVLYSHQVLSLDLRVPLGFSSLT